jgi:release factor glutamine methyltransferase
VTDTLAAAVDRAVARLVAAGWPPADARIDVGVIGRALLGWDTASWLSYQRAAAPADFAARLAAAVDRRAAHEPVAYITGEREFYGRPFLVTRDVLIPRPETELLVEAVLSWLRDQAPSPKPQAPSLLEIGTGSGCIAAILACERSGVQITATDLSPAALALARHNARALGVEDRITFLEGSLTADAKGPFDLVVSNPPYVALADRPTLAPDVRDFEPALALFGGDDGLDVIRELVRAAAGVLSPTGALMMEIGAGQSTAVTEILAAARSFDPPRFLSDLQAIPRCVIARRAATSCRSEPPPRR